MKKKNISLLLSFILITITLFAGCKGAEEEPVDTQTALNDSVISLPKSLKSDQTAARSALLRQTGSDDMSGVYEGVTQYIAFAENFKDLAKTIMLSVVSDQIFDLPQNVYTPITDSSDAGAPAGYKIENTAGETYEWKISLYWVDEASGPELIIRFTLANGGAKGRIIWTTSYPDEKPAATGIDLTIQAWVDLTFDGTTSKKTLEIKFIQDLGNINDTTDTTLFGYANNNWDTLTADQKTALDLGRPSKVFLYAEKQNGVFTIYGTSYHPGWKLESTLKGEDTFWGDARNIYMFKAKAEEGTPEQAKLYLALPEKTLNTVTDQTWVDNSIGEVFSDIMVTQVNKYIGDRANTSIDADPAKTSAQEQWDAFYALSWILGDNIYSAFSLTDHNSFSGTFSTAQFNAAQSFWTGETNLDFLYQMDYDSDTDFDVNDLQSVYNNASTADKSNYYLYTMAPEIISAYSTSSGITKTQLEAFVANPPSGADTFAANYNSIKFLINPALFSDSGFLGTYDEANSIFYEYTSGSGLAEQSAVPSTVTDILSNSSLDLSGIPMYVPNEVRAAKIVVQ